MSLRVQEYEPNWNELAWTTLHILGTGDAPHGAWDRLVMSFLAVCDELRRDRVTLFANPQFEVRCSAPDDKFYATARRCQQQWLRECRQVLPTFELELRDEDRILRQLRFTGVMFAAGRHLFPGQWPPQQKPKHDLAQQRFGRLTVLRKARGHKWECRCDCGATVFVRRQHLLGERAKSCGCWKREIDERAQARKEYRRWNHSGQL